MLDVLAITSPLFILIGVGYLMVKTGVIDRADIPALGKLVITFALPALIFRALAQRDFETIFDLGYLAVYGGGSLLSFALVMLISSMFQGRTLTESAITGLGASLSNSGFIGFPLLLALMGPVAPVVLALTMLVENVLMIPLVLTLAETGSSQNIGWVRALGLALTRLSRNPIIMAILLGLGFSLLGIRLPAPLAKAVDMAAAAAGAVALFAIGGTLVRLSVTGMAWRIALPLTGKLVVHPLMVLLLLWLVPPFDPVLQIGALVAACSPMLSIYPVLSARYGMDQEAAATLLATTLASFFTISLAVWLLNLSGRLELVADIGP